MTRCRLVLALAVVVTTLSRSSSAHDPFEITTVARLEPHALVLEVTMARSTALRLTTGAAAPRATFAAAAFREYAPKLETIAPSLYAVTADGRPLALRAVSAKLTDEGDVELVVASASRPHGLLALRASHLGGLPEGYTSALRVASDASKPTYFKLLTGVDPSFELDAGETPEPPRTPLRDYAPALLLVGVLVAGRVAERLARSGKNAGNRRAIPHADAAPVHVADDRRPVG